MNRATRIALAARELISEIESEYRVPLDEVRGSHLCAPVDRVAAVRLAAAIDADADTFEGRVTWVLEL